MRILDGHDTPLRCVAYSPDGQTLAAGDHGEVILWSLPAGERGKSLRVNPVQSIEALAFSPDGKRLAAGLPHAVVVWEEQGGAWSEVAPQGAHEGGVRGLAWSPDGRLLASGGWQRTLRWWTFEMTQAAETVQTVEPVTCLAFFPEGDRLLAATSHGKLEIWQRGEPTRWKQTASLESLQAIYSLALTRDGNLFATGHADGTINLWDARRREQVATLPGHDWVVYGLAFTPDGSRLVSGSADGTVRLWDVPSRRPVETYRWHDSWITCIAVAPDGMTAASGGDDYKVVVWDLADA